MGTRADFYVGRGEAAEWIGSIAYDGYPEGIDEDVLTAHDEFTYRAAVKKFFEERDDVTMPSDGWPWPWEDSRTTDYSYALDDRKVWASCFGCKWYDPRTEPDLDSEEYANKEAVFPKFGGAAKNVATPGSKQSGMMLFSVPAKMLRDDDQRRGHALLFRGARQGATQPVLPDARGGRGAAGADARRRQAEEHPAGERGEGVAKGVKQDDEAQGFTCGPSTKRCRCQCPDGPCEHKWDGESVSGDLWVSVTCSKCGMTSMSHSMWVGP